MSDPIGLRLVIEGAGDAVGGAAEPQRPDAWVDVILAAFHAGRQLRRALAQYTHACHVTDAEFLLLWACGREGDRGVAQAELVGRLGVSAAQLSHLVYDARDRGWIEIERPAQDRRRQTLRISESGRVVLTTVLQALRPLAERLDRQVPPAERQACCEMLAHLSSVEPSVVAMEWDEQGGLVKRTSSTRRAG